jgi:hypothetical protein
MIWCAVRVGNLAEHVYLIMEPRNVDLQMFAFLGRFRCDPPAVVRLCFLQLWR